MWKTLLEITFLVTSITGDDESNRSKIANFDNFNVLLNLFKWKPLIKSQLYKSFSNRILLPNRNFDAASDFDPSESFFNRTRSTLSVKQLKNIVYANNFSKEIRPPDFDVQNIDTEKFTIDMPIETVNESFYGKDDFNHLIGNLESEDDHIPVTMMLPVNNTNSLPLLNTNDTFFKAVDVNYVNVDEVFSTAYPPNANDIYVRNENYNMIDREYGENEFSNNDVEVLG